MEFQNCGPGVGFTASSNASTSSAASSGVIDPLVCSAGTAGSETTIFPTACLNTPKGLVSELGLEMNDNYVLSQGTQNIYELRADDGVRGTPVDRALYIEVATYKAADAMVLSAESINGQKLEILNICNLATSDFSDRTKGAQRPQSDSILQFSVRMPAGTRALKFDFGNSKTPTYIGVWNLGDFAADLAKPSSNPFPSAQSNQFRVMHALPAPLNDNLDTANPRVCK